MKDFFISYNKADEQWAVWIAWILEQANYTVVIQAWDFRPGENFVLKMQEAAAETRQTIAVLSENYLNAEYTHPEWAAAFARDPQGSARVLIPIRVSRCNPTGLLQSIIYVDIVGLSESEASKAIVEGLKERAKPVDAPSFPVSTKGNESTQRVTTQRVKYPGSPDDLSDTGNVSNVPSGIPFFTGREETLTRLHEALQKSGATALAQRQAISGLGGIGKTQTALEYARRHRTEYRFILWAVAESRESLISDFVALAGVLNLPEAHIQDQTFTVKAVKEWLERNSNWLLILDNADEPATIVEFLPQNSTGHLIVTSRAQVFDSLGILNPVEMDEMKPDDARDFLLKRTGRFDLISDEAEAVAQLAGELDYLPLALEQAGAYIKELRGSFKDYLISYQKRGLELLEKGHAVGKYRKSVRTTWSLNFQQVEETSAAAADLLRVSAFLSPDRIPSELISEGAPELGPNLSTALINVESDPLALDEVLKPLIQYSLIHRDRQARTYDIHRLVQAVLRDGMNGVTQRLWAERTVKSMASAMLDVDALDFSEWYRIERLLSHSQVCAELVREWQLESPEAADLLNLTGRYLHLRGRLADAELLYRSSLTIKEKNLGLGHVEVATSLFNRGWLHVDQGEFEQAETLLLRALVIREESLGDQHPIVVSTLNLLGRTYVEQGRYRKAEAVLQQALSIPIDEKKEPLRYEAITSMVLGDLYYKQTRIEEAEHYYRRGLEELERRFGMNHPSTAPGLGALALILLQKKEFPEAEILCLRSISLEEETFGSTYPTLGTRLANLAALYVRQDRFSDAKLLFERSLKITEAAFGPNHPNLAQTLMLFAESHRFQQQYAEGESVLFRALMIQEQALGTDHPEVGKTLVQLAWLYARWKKYSKGQALVERATRILKKVFGEENPVVIDAMIVKATLLRGMNRKGEAQKLEAQARKLEGRGKKKRPKKLR